MSPLHVGQLPTSAHSRQTASGAAVVSALTSCVDIAVSSIWLTDRSDAERFDDQLSELRRARAGGELGQEASLRKAVVQGDRRVLAELGGQAALAAKPSPRCRSREPRTSRPRPWFRAPRSRRPRGCRSGTGPTDWPSALPRCSPTRLSGGAIGRHPQTRRCCTRAPELEQRRIGLCSMRPTQARVSPLDRIARSRDRRSAIRAHQPTRADHAAPLARHQGPAGRTAPNGRGSHLRTRRASA
jgi:hypothetical protein